jgi:hypothetical protein
LFYLESGNLDDPITAEGMMEILIADRRDSFPDVEICLDEADSVLPNGPPSRTVILCYTGQTQSGNTYPATLFLEAGVSDGGTTYYYLKVLSDDGIWDSVVEEVIPVFDTIRWKLYAG